MLKSYSRTCTSILNMSPSRLKLNNDINNVYFGKTFKTPPLIITVYTVHVQSWVSGVMQQISFKGEVHPISSQS